MGKRTEASIIQRRALNQGLIYASHVPAQVIANPAVFVRALRSALHMTQAQLARRSGVTQAHIAQLETGAIDLRIDTVRRLFDAMFCDLMILPRARKRPGDALAERKLEGRFRRRIWDD
jgi:transcriptional regulator with XRE-family HTH domain